MDEQQLMQAFAKMLRNEVEKHDLPSGFTLTTNFMHGVNGVFGGAGISQDIFSTRIKPRGILGMLPAFGARDTHPLVGFLTGFTTGDGSAGIRMLRAMILRPLVTSKGVRSGRLSVASWRLPILCRWTALARLSIAANSLTCGL